jgi:hypothetical protein
MVSLWKSEILNSYFGLKKGVVEHPLFYIYYMQKISKFSLFDKLCDCLTIQDMSEIMTRCMSDNQYFVMHETEQTIDMLYILDEEGNHEIKKYIKIESRKSKRL